MATQDVVEYATDWPVRCELQLYLRRQANARGRAAVWPGQSGMRAVHTLSLVLACGLAGVQANPLAPSPLPRIKGPPLHAGALWAPHPGGLWLRPVRDAWPRKLVQSGVSMSIFHGYRWVSLGIADISEM